MIIVSGVAIFFISPSKANKETVDKLNISAGGVRKMLLLNISLAERMCEYVRG